MQIKKQAKVYDVVVIGSGASGGMAAWNLTRQGVNVLLLDAGGRFDRQKFWTHVLPYEARERQARGEQAPQFFLSKTTEQILRAAKAEIVQFKRGDYDIPGTAIHEHGTCRMGADPKTSALNSFNQIHAVKNLFVVDGSSFPSAAEKNPTLTIPAIAWRATDYLATEMKKGTL